MGRQISGCEVSSVPAKGSHRELDVYDVDKLLQPYPWGVNKEAVSYRRSRRLFLLKPLHVTQLFRVRNQFRAREAL